LSVQILPILATNIRNVRILLLGEFSRLHNTLKEGLEQLGHEVVLANNGDGFKNYPADFSFRATFFLSKWGNIIRQFIYRLTGFDLVLWEHGFRYKAILPKLGQFDCIQLINEKPIQTTPKKELKLLQKTALLSPKFFLLCSGADTYFVTYLLANTQRYSLFKPYWENPVMFKKQYAYMFEYLEANHQAIHEFLKYNGKGIIATDMDYVLAVAQHKHYSGFIPNPINLERITFEPLTINEKIVVFLGINSGTRDFKGIHYFEEALTLLPPSVKEQIELIVTTDIPYHAYRKHYERAHIILDQVLAFDQGYNALEAMAAGKVVFTGAETEFCEHFGIAYNTVAINALPNAQLIANELETLIQHPEQLVIIGKQARKFIEKHHHYVRVAEKYLAIWNA
jgi:glycosyltransferase involved in cell wall biosynthesis